jgi:hypothetical protein
MGYVQAVDIEFRIDALTPVGDDRVLARLRLSFEGKTSGLKAGGELFHCFWLRHSRVFRQEDHLTLSGAVRAAPSAWRAKPRSRGAAGGEDGRGWVRTSDLSRVKRATRSRGRRVKYLQSPRLQDDRLAGEPGRICVDYRGLPWIRALEHRWCPIKTPLARRGAGMLFR